MNKKVDNFFNNLNSNIYDANKTIFFKYINNGELTKIVEDKDIPTHNLPDEILSLLTDLTRYRMLEAPEFLTTATQDAGNSEFLRIETDHLLRNGKISQDYIGSYGPTGKIHIIGNFASEQSLIDEGNVGLINWYLKQFDILNLQQEYGNSNFNYDIINNFFNIDKEDVSLNVDGSLNYKLSYETKLDSSLFNYNFLKYLINIYDRNKTKITDRTNKQSVNKFVGRANTLFKKNPLNDNTNKEIKNGILDLNDSDIAAINILFDNYKSEILDFLFCYNLFINDVHIIMKNYISKLSVAYQRYKIIDEKLNMIHWQNDDILTKRGFTNVHRIKADSDSEYNKQKNIKIGNIGRLLNYIQINIYSYIYSKYDLFFNFCVNFKTLEYNFHYIISDSILKIITQTNKTNKIKYVTDIIIIKDWLDTLPNQNNLQQTDLDAFITLQNSLPLDQRVDIYNLDKFLRNLGPNINYFYPNV